ncbi:hypothetical protein ADA01nite_24230 [Aneurinibacillus danicus]|jgi:hypothetical protein|uniref:Uncharacterized protein n=1 Tax=Aneurinibacillus danicus TaxID=267746 RepID=A0A511VBN4_9BACL|nr:hypothetical protein ADA01nite_24230 [Aneurinibacillus danicus]
MAFNLCSPFRLIMQDNRKIIQTIIPLLSFLYTFFSFLLLLIIMEEILIESTTRGSRGAGLRMKRVEVSKPLGPDLVRTSVGK